MDKKKADWIKLWGRSLGAGYNYEPRLQKAVSSPHARQLLEWFKANKLPPDGLAFCLTQLAWPYQILRQDIANLALPKTVVWSKAAKQCRKIARSLRKYGVITDLPKVGDVCRLLEEYAERLQTGRFSLQTRHGAITYEAAQSIRRQSNPKKTVIGFLRAYFILAGDPKRLRHIKRNTWSRITDVLLLAGLERPDAKPNRVATTWTNGWRRRRNNMAEINYQAMIYLWFLAVAQTIGAKHNIKSNEPIYKELAKYYLADTQSRPDEIEPIAIHVLITKKLKQGLSTELR